MASSSLNLGNGEDSSMIEALGTQYLLLEDAENQCKLLPNAANQSQLLSDAENPSQLLRHAENPSQLLRHAENPSQLRPHAENPSQLPPDAGNPSQLPPDAENPSQLPPDAENPSQLLPTAETQNTLLSSACPGTSTPINHTRPGKELRMTDAVRTSWNLPATLDLILTTKDVEHELRLEKAQRASEKKSGKSKQSKESRAQKALEEGLKWERVAQRMPNCRMSKKPNFDKICQGKIQELRRSYGHYIRTEFPGINTQPPSEKERYIKKIKSVAVLNAMTDYIEEVPPDDFFNTKATCETRRPDMINTQVGSNPTKRLRMMTPTEFPIPDPESSIPNPQNPPRKRKGVRVVLCGLTDSDEDSNSRARLEKSERCSQECSERCNKEKLGSEHYCEKKSEDNNKPSGWEDSEDYSSEGSEDYSPAGRRKESEQVQPRRSARLSFKADVKNLGLVQQKRQQPVQRRRSSRLSTKTPAIMNSSFNFSEDSVTSGSST